MALSAARAVRTRETQRRLLAAAADVLRARGFKAATVGEIAARAGFTTGAVYAHFDGKEDLYLTLLEEHLDDRLREVRATGERSAVDDIGAVVGDRFVRVLDEQKEWVLLFMELAPHAARDEGFSARLAERHRRIREAIAAQVDDRAGALGVTLPIESESLATALIALSNGLAMERATGRAPVPDDLYGRILALLIRGLVASVDPPPRDS